MHFQEGSASKVNHSYVMRHQISIAVYPVRDCTLMTRRDLSSVNDVSLLPLKRPSVIHEQIFTLTHTFRLLVNGFESHYKPFLR